ncbi:hypothetical protein VSR34_37390 [Paraburkholderia sp. JHI2823]|uniref:hypothetical protein n=1 Tax=Paraburkholderia sp. JHI2823 TaxID=3112960 RepID=UPI003176C080
MYPLTWLWCPQYNYPLSGAVDQSIALPGARDPHMERSITHIFSYGSQLGRILEALEPMVNEFYEYRPDINQEPAHEFDQMLSDIKAIRSLRQATKSEKNFTVSDLAEVMKQWKAESKHSTYLHKLREVRANVARLIDEADRTGT